MNEVYIIMNLKGDKILGASKSFNECMEKIRSEKEESTFILRTRKELFERLNIMLIKTDKLIDKCQEKINEYDRYKKSNDINLWQQEVLKYEEESNEIYEEYKNIIEDLIGKEEIERIMIDNKEDDIRKKVKVKFMSKDFLNELEKII